MAVGLIQHLLKPKDQTSYSTRLYPWNSKMFSFYFFFKKKKCLISFCIIKQKLLCRSLWNFNIFYPYKTTESIIDGKVGATFLIWIRFLDAESWWFVKNKPAILLFLGDLFLFVYLEVVFMSIESHFYFSFSDVPLSQNHARSVFWCFF